MDSILKGHAGKWIRRCVLFILDLCLIYLSLRVAILMRYENHVSAGTLKKRSGYVDGISNIEK